MKLPDDWCKHKQTFWRLLTDHINDYFDGTNFAYAYYQPSNGKPLFLIAKSNDAIDYINNMGELSDVCKSLLSELGLVFCTLLNNSGYYKFHRVHEDLSFREISIIDTTSRCLATQQTCCERMIFGNIAMHLHREKIFEENVKVELNGEKI